ncbi:Arc family DNA-binding protein, partial [Xylella fastidiosa]
RAADQFIVRLPDGMRGEISAAATANNRSMNAEIVSRLQQSFDSDGDLDVDVREIAQKVAQQRGLSFRDALRL